jgi:hypothetical protein
MTHAGGTWIRAAALTNPLWEQIRDHQQAFSGSFAWANEPFDLSQSGEYREVERLRALLGRGSVLRAAPDDYLGGR